MLIIAESVALVLAVALAVVIIAVQPGGHTGPGTPTPDLTKIFNAVTKEGFELKTLSHRYSARNN